MNIPRSALRRRQFIQSGSVLALGAVTSTFAASRLLRGLRQPDESRSVATHSGLILQRPQPSSLPSASHDQPDPRPAGRPLEFEDEYADFLTSLELRHLAPHEVIDPHRGIVNGIENSLPPKHLWEQLALTLKVADEIRERLGLPLCRITSAYRDPRYNAVIPGAVRGSYHTRNIALDLVYFCAPRKAYQMAVQLRNERFFRGGIGLYSSFIHLDTRGYAATWGRA